MPYDQGLASRIRKILGDAPGLTETQMFGGIGFLLHGNMACGVHKDRLVVRVGPANYDSALAMPHTRPSDITGRPMRGWVMIEAGGSTTDKSMSEWVQQDLQFARTLPAK